MRRIRGLTRLTGRVLLALLAAGFGCATYVYLRLPDVRELRTTNPGTTAFMERRAAEAVADGRQPRRVQRWVRYTRISPQLVRAVLVAEDSAFWQHSGVDFQQIRESLEINLERMEFARGASTITQQLAKNLYLSPSKNPLRKAKELLIARRLEAELTKLRILELYLNVIEWGEGIYGAEAASRRYFGRAAAELGPSESALLAAAIINPRVLDPARPGARLRRRQQMILQRMGAAVPPPALADGVNPPENEAPAMPLPEGPPIVLPGRVLPGGDPASRAPGRASGS